MLISNSFGQSLTPNNVDTLLKQHFADSNLVIIDVCTDAVYASGHLQNAIHRDLYLSTFNTDLNTMSKSKIYLLTCISGNRSSTAMATMKTKGFSHVYDISEGITNWTNSGYKVTSSIAKSEIRFMSVQDFSNQLNLSVLPIIIDLRTNSLFVTKHLMNAQNMDVSKTKIEATFTDKSKKYFIYGESVTGVDSLLFYNLYLNGYQNVCILKDGFSAWEAANYPIVEDTAITAIPVNSILSFKTFIDESTLVIIPDFSCEAQYSIFSTDSRLIAIGKITGETIVSTGNIPHGIYIINIKTKTNSLSKLLYL